VAGTPRIGRREVLAGGAASLATGVVAGIGAVGCNGPGDGDALRSGVPTTLHTARLAGDPFALGVASGDPLPDRVVLWTRLAPAPLTGGRGGMPDDRVDVIWQVATDERFTRVVAEGTTTAEPAYAHAVHVDAAGLEPSRTYLYRFTVGEWTSPIGRTRTAPDTSAALRRLRLGIVCCQNFGAGRYAAYRHLLREDLDLVVHLGDYIYELPLGLAERPVLPAAVPAGLDDYRLRHASYRSDPDLRAAHARYPFTCMWDDHEVIDNYAGDTEPDPTATAASVLARRAAAYRAYWEHLPLRLAPPDGPDATLYRALTFGDLVRLYLLDERQYAAEPPCRDTSANDLGNCPGRDDDREYLGEAQDRWLDGALVGGRATWKLVGNPTVLAGVNLGDGATARYYLDTWDGYPAARRRFVGHLADDRVANPVVLTGDWHAGMVNDVHLDPEDHGTEVVATELVTPAISSTVYEAPRGPNPQIRHQVLRNGYLVLEIERERLAARFRVLDDVMRADSGLATDSTWLLTPGVPQARRL